MFPILVILEVRKLIRCYPFSFIKCCYTINPTCVLIKLERGVSRAHFLRLRFQVDLQLVVCVGGNFNLRRLCLDISKLIKLETSPSWRRFLSQSIPLFFSSKGGTRQFCGATGSGSPERCSRGFTRTSWRGSCWSQRS